MNTHRNVMPLGPIAPVEVVAPFLVERRSFTAAEWETLHASSLAAKRIAPRWSEALGLRGRT